MAEMTIAGVTFNSQEAYIRSGRRCATPHVSRYQITRVDNALAAFRAANAAFRAMAEPVTINVQFIHFTVGTEGRITEPQRRTQIEVLNNAYRDHRIQFNYNPATVVEVENRRWFRMGYGSAAEREAKRNHQVDPSRNLNFYTAGLGDGLLGWATFPWELAGDSERDGVVMLYSTLPGGSTVPYNLGQTATHEVGHWLGLYHTFQGGCDAMGDHIGDTVAHADAIFGKPEEGLRHNACDPNQQAPIHNFMNYVDDDWMTHFTLEQGQRIRDQIGTFRSSLLETGASENMRRALVAIALED
jgi:Pregnancy-associated plasma protein-A